MLNIDASAFLGSKSNIIIRKTKINAKTNKVNTNIEVTIINEKIKN